jgi:hypothetical protein
MATKRPTFPKISEEMKRFSALLEGELKRWPGVRTGKMFGMVSVYRGDCIFAFLPVTRGLEGANSIMVKLEQPAKSEGKKWESLEVLTEADLAPALARLQRAYDKAGTR